MKIIHTADLHLGQVIYQNYERADEHECFFNQLEDWCRQQRPDALVVAGDVFDIQQPSAATWRVFTDTFVRLREAVRDMKIVVVAGNHDSASRLQSNGAVWGLADVRIVGTPPPAKAAIGEVAEVPTEDEADWRERFVVRLPSGYIVALPFMAGERPAVAQALLDYVAEENTQGLPVVMTGHLAATGCDMEGHSEIGRIRSQPLSALGRGYDYLALGHIHKPQTLNHPDDCMKEEADYASPVARYAGSALHVSFDEAYPHSVSLVEIDRRGGRVKIVQKRINELRHFFTLPVAGSEACATADEALEALKGLAAEGREGYFALRFKKEAAVPSDFNQRVYSIIEPANRLRYNPRLIWEGQSAADEHQAERPLIELPDIQEMTREPLKFVEKIIDRYPELSLDTLRKAFAEIEARVKAAEEGAKAAKPSRAAKNEKKEKPDTAPAKA